MCVLKSDSAGLCSNFEQTIGLDVYPMLNFWRYFLDKSRVESGAESLFEQPLDVLSIGLDGFAEDLSTFEVQVMQLDWRPPADGDPELAELLSKLGS